MEILIFIALLVAFILIGFAIRAASLRKITEDVTHLMIAEHFGVRPEPDGLKKWSKLQNDHPELYRKAQVAALVIAENRRRQIKQLSKLVSFSQTQVSQNPESEEKNDQ
ncbi:MAG TPA: hypothetical protein VG324_29480 [Blastocatellia bacterium]|nr:hypothetical protein [Blastocatellia bacterium]